MATSDPSEVASSASASNGLSSTNDAAGPSPFVSQPFSAATEMILKRLRGEGGPLNPTSVLGLTSLPQTAAYEDVRRTVLEGMKTSHNMEFAVSTPAPRRAPKAPRTGSTSGKGAASGTPAGRKGNAKSRKRKRVKDESDESAGESEEMSDLGDEDESDDSTSVTAFPSMTQSGRKVVKPAQFVPEVSAAPPRKRSAQSRRSGRSVENALCKRCGRGHSPASNMIVFCDGCNIGWHQMCHDPVITEEVVKDETKEWFCAECRAKREKKKGERAKSNTPNSAANNSANTAWAGKSAAEVCSSPSPSQA
jgi:succinate---hydroxymethylglutarate CoA-transferase